MIKEDRADEPPKPRRRMLAVGLAGLLLPAGFLFVWNRSREPVRHTAEPFKQARDSTEPRALPTLVFSFVSTPEFHVPPIDDLHTIPVPGMHGSRPGNLELCDLNHDGACNDADRELLASRLGTCRGDPRYHIYADVVPDGCVDSKDAGFLNLLLLQPRVLASPDQLFPADHRMVPVTVSASMPASYDVSLACRIVSVTSNETEPDATLVDDDTVLLRAERSGAGATRIYTIHVECTDASGDSFLATTLVTVPHDKGR